MCQLLKPGKILLEIESYVSSVYLLVILSKCVVRQINATIAKQIHTIQLYVRQNIIQTSDQQQQIRDLMNSIRRWYH